jgi:hypothetical protein
VPEPNVKPAQIAIRKICGGKVVVCGKIYAPLEKLMKYDGRLDGKWCVFGRFLPDHTRLYLWGLKLRDTEFGTIGVAFSGLDLIAIPLSARHGDNELVFPWADWRYIGDA